MIRWRIPSGPVRFWLGVAGLVTAAAAVATDSRLAGWAAVVAAGHGGREPHGSLPSAPFDRRRGCPLMPETNRGVAAY